MLKINVFSRLMHFLPEADIQALIELVRSQNFGKYELNEIKLWNFCLINNLPQYIPIYATFWSGLALSIKYFLTSQFYRNNNLWPRISFSWYRYMLNTALEGKSYWVVHRDNKISSSFCNILCLQCVSVSRISGWNYQEWLVVSQRVSCIWLWSGSRMMKIRIWIM